MVYTTTTTRTPKVEIGPSENTALSPKTLQHLKQPIWDIPGCKHLRKHQRNLFTFLTELIKAYTRQPENTPEEKDIKKDIHTALKTFLIYQEEPAYWDRPDNFNINTLPHEFWRITRDHANWPLVLEIYKEMPAASISRILNEDIPNERPEQQLDELTAIHQNPLYNQVPLEYFLKLYSTHNLDVDRYIKKKHHKKALNF